MLPSEITLSRKATTAGSVDLVVAINGSTDQVTVLNQFLVGGSQTIEKIEFDDGTVWGSETIATAAITPIAAGTVQGTSGDDYFDLRYATNNTVYGNTPNYDSGNDTYIFGMGAGQDTIKDYGVAPGNADTIRIADLLPSEITLSRKATTAGSVDLVIKVNGSTDQVTVFNQFLVGGGQTIEKIEFDDGTVWGSETIATAAITPIAAGTVQGTSGDDYFDLRYATNNTVYGNTPNYDSGNDTYIFGAGSGQDIIQDYSSSPTEDVVRVSGISASEITMYRAASSPNLVIKIGSTGDTLTILNHFLSSGYGIEGLAFENTDLYLNRELFDIASTLGELGGNVLKVLAEAGTIEKQIGTSGNDLVSGSGLSNILATGGGADVIVGGANSDVIWGGSGIDSLSGGIGEDVFLIDSIEATDIDTILDFDAQEDCLCLDQFVFEIFSNTGAISSDNFISGHDISNGIDSDDYFIYDTSSGILYFDTDGSGETDSVPIVTLTGAPSIEFNNIVIY